MCRNQARARSNLRSALIVAVLLGFSPTGTSANITSYEECVLAGTHNVQERGDISDVKRECRTQFPEQCTELRQTYQRVKPWNQALKETLWNELQYCPAATVSENEPQSK